MLDDIKNLILPPNAILFNSAANSMYNNIDTDHALKVLYWWLDKLKPDLPSDFSLDAMKYAIYYIMKNNIFEWGTVYLLQLIGAAMGTSAAVMWATIFF